VFAFGAARRVEEVLKDERVVLTALPALGALYIRMHNNR